jgi:succinate dehydrogenase / fumarate reductase cytochrome b subunit
MTDLDKSQLHAARPLSPHLQVYRLPMAALMSISHRITGAALAGGCVLFTAFLMAAAVGPGAYGIALALAYSWFGQVCLFLLLGAFYYHLCSGIRHLIWDTGRMFEKSQAFVSGWIVLAATIALTLGTWFGARLWGI